MYRLVFLICLTLSNVVFALTMEEIEYPRAEVYKSGSTPIEERMLVTSAVKRINNDLSIESKRTVQRASQYLILKLPQAGSLRSAYEFYRDLLEKYGHIEYVCAKRDCGINSYWANNIFRNTELKGRDSSQYYVAGTIDIEGVTYFLSSYLIENFLRKKLIFLDLVPLIDDEAKHNSNVRWEQGYLLGGVNFDKALIDGVMGRRVIELVAYVPNDQIVNSVQEKMILRDSLIIQEWIKRALGAGVEVRLITAGHRNVEMIDADRSHWFRVFAY